MHPQLSTRRGRPLVGRLMIVVVFAVGMALFPSPAAAEQPIKWPHEVSGTGLLYKVDGTEPCPFSVTVEYAISETLTAFVNDQGEWVQGHHQSVEQDTYSANGKTLVGLPRHYTMHFYFEPSPGWPPIMLHGSAEGVLHKVPLPDGSLFIVAGRLEWDSNYVMTSFKGTPGDWDAFCAALAP